MDYKEQFIALGFSPKENTVYIYSKKYSHHGGYAIHVDFEKSIINYGSLIVSDSKTTQNFSQSENFVVLECVDRLLEKGYKPQDIILEKVYPSGHGHSGRLDILINKDGKAFLMIECKTWGSEFEKEFKKIRKDGGQLLTYFQNDTNADYLMLYASRLTSGGVKYCSEIIKIEDNYRTAGNVEDVFARWSKLTCPNGIFEEWVKPYNFESKSLIFNELVDITPEDSSFIFNHFLEILRHNVVSDKPNAFNKIFTLFLCKIYDEKVNEDTNSELGFQWIDGIDDDISFQLRLTDLYKNGMYEFLEKRVTDFSEEEFSKRYTNLDDSVKYSILQEFKKLRLEKNNEFAIKEVYDEKSFKENAKVVKQVVELLQRYKIRYAGKQQYLSDFFELLLTTGLKQESGQFFTPVPIAQFIIKSLPINDFVESKLRAGEKDALLPFVIDYAAGSGHFITESMNEIQRLLKGKNINDYRGEAKKLLKTAEIAPFDWALQYVYGIEKDYRLVKVGKVGCYLHGDGLANVIHSDGLAKFGYLEYKEKLKVKDTYFPKENKQFDILVSNPPYSVSAFKNAAREYYGSDDFELYNSLTDNSSEIECLFVERSKQLLKDGGVAGIILPSSILSNTGIYTKAREIILQHFEIVAIAELGSNTFMATGTNTVVLFLRRRNNYESIHLKDFVSRFFFSLKEVNSKYVENPVTKYINHVWGNITFADYVTLLQKKPNQEIQNHEIYQEYRKKIKAKNDAEFWDIALKLEEEKLYYFILAYPQKVVLVKSGEREAEKRFLGYEFSNRRGNEGIHPIQRGKTIDECTKLFDSDNFTNPKKTKASTYIYEAFNGNYNFPIDDSMKDNVFRTDLVDMLTFDRIDFEKTISLAVKKKVKIESKWEIVRLGNVCDLYQPKTITSQEIKDTGKYKVFGANGIIGFYDKYNHKESEIAVTCRGATCGKVNYTEPQSWITGNAMVVKPKNEELNKRFLFYLLSFMDLSETITGTAQPQITRMTLEPYKIPLPTKDVQERIVSEIEKIEKQEEAANHSTETLKSQLFSLLSPYPRGIVSDLCHVSNEKINPQNDPDAEYLYLGLEHIESQTGLITVNKEIGRNILSAKNVFCKGDVLYGKLRPYLNKVIIAENDGICSTDILVLKTNIPKILKYALLSDDLVKQTSDRMRGVSLPRIGIKDFLNQRIPLPPLPDQQRIVTEIEKLENQIAESQKIIDRSLELKDAVLKKYL